MPAFTHDRVRARGVADLVFFPLEDHALHSDPASRVLANGLHFSRIPYVTDMLMHNRVDATETSSYRTFSSVSLTPSPHNPYWKKKKQEPRLSTYAALKCFIMNWYDVYNPSACLFIIVHPRVTQTRSMDVSTMSIVEENSRKTSVHLKFSISNFLNVLALHVCMCVGHKLC